MTDRMRGGHPADAMHLTAAIGPAQVPVPAPARAPARLRRHSGIRRSPLELGDIYERWFDFVWRSVRRLGVQDGWVDDVVQEVFLVAHRRLDDFEGRSSVKTWLFGIARNVVRDHRRSQRRRGTPESLRESWVGAPGAGPHERAASQEAAAVLHALLDQLDDDKREVFVLAELEQMTAPEIAEALQVNLNTVYSRLRAARQSFNQAVLRHRARDERRLR